MNDREFAAEFIRVDRDATAIRIMVMRVHWAEGPHTPTSDWKCAETLAPAATSADVDQAVTAVLHDRSHFPVCNECGARQIHGWMFDEGDDICQGCAEGTYGVVH